MILKIARWFLLILILSVLIVLMANIFGLGIQEYYLQHSSYPENIESIVNKDRVYLFVLVLPICFLAFFIASDIRKNYTSWRVIILFLMYLACYAVILYFKKYTVGYSISTLLLVITYFFWKGKHLSKSLTK